MKIHNERGFSHSLLVISIAILVVLFSGWFVYSNRSNTNNEVALEDSGTKKTSQEFSNLLADMKANLKQYNPEFIEQSEKGAVINVSDGLTATTQESIEWGFNDSSLTESQISASLESLLIKKINSRSQNSIIDSNYESDLIFCSLRSEVQNLKLNCLDRSTKDELANNAEAALAFYKNSNVYKDLVNKDYFSEPSYSVNLSKSSDNALTGAEIIFPVLGYGRAVFLINTNDSWNIVTAQSTAREDLGSSLTNEDCTKLLANTNKDVFEFVTKYSCK